MTGDQLIVLAVLLVTFALFLRGTWRYDVVAMGALIALVLLRVTPAEGAFAGFGHPAVVTVAAVLVWTRGLQNSGVVDILAGWLLRAGERTTPQVAASTTLVAASSAFMNNVGALALFLPVALRVARQRQISPSVLLMPLSFASLLGGLVTLVGTPPNIIIAIERGRVSGEAFRMFDFAPVGGTVAIVGVIFIALVGWRLIPQREGAGDQQPLFEISEYLTEVRVTEDSQFAGATVASLREKGLDAVVAGIVRGERRMPAPAAGEPILANDVLLLRADSETLQELLEGAGLEPARDEKVSELLGSDEVALMETVVQPRSRLDGRSPVSADLHRRYGVNVLAISRRGRRIPAVRVGRTRLEEGDVLLVQVPTASARETFTAVGLLPLAQRGLRLRQPPRVLLAMLISAAALILGAALRLIPIEIALTLAAGGMLLTNIISLEEAYEAIDWPIIILLGAMIPVGEAMQSTGLAERVALGLVAGLGGWPMWVLVAVVLVATMFLSDIINNAAAAIVMAPIAVGVAASVGQSVDPFFMAVAIGASCAFLTPIGHQANVLVMGPGGYRFGDYWRMGLPLEVVIAAVAVPMIMLVWTS